jgi:hypothetical protein
MTVGRGVTTLMVVDVTDDGGLLTTPAGVVHDEPYKVAIWVKGTWTVIVTGASMVETEPKQKRMMSNTKLGLRGLHTSY